MSMKSLFVFIIFIVTVAGSYFLTRKDVREDKSLSKKGFIKFVFYYASVFIAVVLFIGLTQNS